MKKYQKTTSVSLYDTEYYKTKNHGYSEFLQGYKLLPEFESFIFKNIRSTDKVLDVGCGRGEIIVGCHQKNISCIGIDYSPSAIVICKDTLSKNGINVHNAKLMDAKKLDFPDESFNVVIMLDVVEHLYDWELNRAVDEAHRVLKQKGRLLIHTSPNRNNMSFLRTIASLFGVKFESDKFHVNEQTPHTLNQTLSRKFKVINCKLVKDNHYFSKQAAGHRNVVRFLMTIADLIFDSPVVVLLNKINLFSEWLSTDIYVVGEKS